MAGGPVVVIDFITIVVTIFIVTFYEHVQPYRVHDSLNRVINVKPLFENVKHAVGKQLFI